MTKCKLLELTLWMQHHHFCRMFSSYYLNRPMVSLSQCCRLTCCSFKPSDHFQFPGHRADIYLTSTLCKCANVHNIGPDIKVTMAALDTGCLHPKNVQSNPAAGRQGPTQSGQGAVLALPGTQHKLRQLMIND